MRALRSYWAALLFVALSFIAPLAVYKSLPDRVPIHWNYQGQIDGWMPKPWGPFLLPMLSVFVIAIVIIAPRVSPKGFEMSPFARVYPTIAAAIAGVQFYLTALVLAAGLGASIAMNRHIPAIMGILFVVLGNYLGKVTRNFFVGIRTPWTLADDVVWERTHRMAGPVFVTGGLFLIAMGFISSIPPVAGLVAIAVSVSLPVIYSFVTWRRSEKSSKARHPAVQGDRPLFSRRD
jgi:uncharacterized membrane protein